METKIPHDMTALEAARLLYPDSSRRTLKNWFTAGRFTADGASVKREDEILRKAQVFCSQAHFQAPKIPGLQILYEDRFLIVIEKPSGLLSVPLDDGKKKRHALGMLRHHYQTDQIFAVHRIDRETSGILVFARGKEAEMRLKNLFEAHDIEREYFAIVEGRMQEENGTWMSCLKELASFDVVEADDGKDAITHFRVVRRSTKYTYLRLKLETGRKHQIRVHSANAGHPVLGDKRYGSQESPIRRLCLHALSLGFIHPFTKNKMFFQSPLPKEFKALGGLPSEISIC